MTSFHDKVAATKAEIAAKVAQVSAILDAIDAGQRGFAIEIETANKVGLSRAAVRKIATDRGFECKPHGKYGYCIMRAGA